MVLPTVQAYITPKPYVCLIIDRGTTILPTLESPEVGWEGDRPTSMYYIWHIAYNFNKKLIFFLKITNKHEYLYSLTDIMQ